MPRPAYYDPTVWRGMVGAVPFTRWSERGATGDDEAGASRLPLSAINLGLWNCLPVGGAGVRSASV